MPYTPAHRSRWLRRFAVAAAVCTVLAVCAVAALPLLGHTDAVRRSIVAELSALAGGAVNYDTLELRLFPRPRATFHGVAIHVPGTVEGRMPTVETGLAFLPLLAGKVRLSDVRIDQPVLEVHVQPRGAGDPFPVYQALLRPIFKALEHNARGMTISVSGGRVDGTSGASRVVALSDLSITAGVSAGAIDLNLSCAADLWRRMQVSARVASGSFAGSSRMQVTGLQAQQLLDAVFAESALAVRPGAIDLSVDSETDGRSTASATLTASTSQLTIARGFHALDLGPVRISAEAALDAEGTTFSVRELRVGELISQASGSLRTQSGGAGPVVELQVPVLDLARLRAAALALGDDLDAVRAVFAPITAGTVHELKLAAAGSDLAALIQPRAVRAQARLEAGAISLPEFGIVVSNGAGHFAFADSALQGSGLTGDIGRSSFTAGALTVELLPGASLRSLQATLDADLGEALAIARRIVARQGGTLFTGIESVRGRTAGAIQYEARRGSPGLVVEMAKTRATGRYRDVPFPLEVNTGELRYSGDRVFVRGLAGRAGHSRLQAGAIDVTLGREPAIRAGSGNAVLVLDEIYPWLTTLDALRPALGNVKILSGTAAVRLTRLSGPLARPSALAFEAVAEPQEVRIEGSALPAPMTLSTGEAIVTADALKLNRLAVSMADSRLTASGMIEDYFSPQRRADVDFSQVTVGPQVLDWARKRWRLPATVMPRAPVGLASAHLQWPGNERDPMLVQGKASFAGAVDADFDLAWKPGNLDLRHLAIKDADSNFTAAFKWSPAGVDLAFDGNFDSRTAGRILMQPPGKRGALRGDLRASIDFREPQRSTAAGTLEVDGLDIFSRWDVPVEIERLRLEVAGETVHLHEGRLKVGGQSLALSGSLERGRAALAIDMRVTAGDLDAAPVIDLITRRNSARAAGGPAGAGWGLPIEGRVAFAAESVTYGEHVFRQVAGTATLAPNRITAEVHEARLCGLVLPLTAVFVPGRVDVTTRLRERGQLLENVLPCLTRERTALTGNYDLDAEFSASGPYDALLRVARGTFRAVFRAGRIQRSQTVTRILSEEHVAERLPDHPSDLMARGLEFTEMGITGTLEDEHVRIENLTLDSPSFGLAMSGEIDPGGGMDMNGLVAPFGGINAVLRRIPILGRLFGIHIVVVPVKITGNVGNPVVQSMPAGAIGYTLVNLMSAIIRAPLELLDPFPLEPQREPFEP